MLKQAKIAKTMSQRLPNLATRLSIEGPQFLSHRGTQKVAIIGNCNRITHDLTTLLAQLGSQVHILTTADIDKNAADLLAEKSPELIKSHNANPKIPNSILTPLKGIDTVLFPYAMSTQEPLELLQIYLNQLTTLAKDGSLKHLILIHPGYNLDRAPKKSILGNRMRALEEAAQAIDPRLKVTVLRYAPIFEALMMSSSSIVEKKVFKFPLQEKGLPFIAAEDIRDSVIRIMYTQDDQPEGQVYSICGDFRVTPQEICEAIKAATDSDIAFEQVPASQLNTALTKLSNAKMAPMYIDWWDHPKHLTKQTEDLEAVLGKSSITIDDWIQLNNHAFV